MIVAMQDVADEGQIQQVIEHLVKLGFEVHRSSGARQTVLGAVGAGIEFDIRNLELLPGVQEVHRISSPYKLAGKSFRPEGTIVKLANGIEIGGNHINRRRSDGNRLRKRLAESRTITRRRTSQHSIAAAGVNERDIARWRHQPLSGDGGS